MSASREAARRHEHEGERAYVPAGPPIGRRDDWIYILDSLIGGTETYAGVVKWLAMYDDLDAALDAARKSRSSDFS